MESSLYRLLRFGNAICMDLTNGTNVTHGSRRHYVMKHGVIYVVDNWSLYENEEQLNEDFNSKCLHRITMEFYDCDKKKTTFDVWNKAQGRFEWHSIFNNMKTMRKQIGFRKYDLFTYNTMVEPLKILCAKAFRDHCGLEACHNIRHVMDYETQDTVFKKQVWWV